MLVSKISANDVVTIKLLTGEEVIGYFVNDDDNNVVLRKPLVPVPTGQGSIGLAPFVMSVNYLEEGTGEIPFLASTVVTMIKTGKQFADVYTKQVSGLDLSQQSKPGLITS